MKLEEISLMEEAKKGTYAAVSLSTHAVVELMKYIKDNDIPKWVKPSNLHTTLLYSRKHLQDFKPRGKLKDPIIGTPTELVVWETSADDGVPPTNCLIMKFDSPALVKRHQDLMKEHGGTFDYDEYEPHVTLSYDIGDLDIKKLPDVKKAIPTVVFDVEYGEDLMLGWANTAHE